MKPLALIGLFLLLVVPVRAQDDTAADTAPYIYYYSNVLKGIVVERADGTDSRVLGRGLVDEDVRWVYGPGWSPDGTWFAWRMDTSGVFRRDYNKGYAVSIDDEPLALLDNFSCIFAMDWHPTDNILLVHGAVDENAECGPLEFPSIVTYWLIDADRQSLLSSFSTESSQRYTFGAAPVLWNLEDDYIQFFEGSFSVQDNPRQHQVTMHYSGVVTVEPISTEDYNLRFEYPDVVPTPGTITKRIGFGPGNYPFVERFAGNEQLLPFDAPPNSGAAGPYVAWFWNPSEEWLFIAYDMCFAGCSYVAGSVSVFNPSTGRNREVADCGTHRACVNWLPERVPIEIMSAGQASSVMPTPVSVGERSGEYFIQAFQTHDLECNPDTRLRDTVANVETGTVDFVLPVGDGCDPSDDDFPYAIVFAFSPNERYYAITEYRSEYTSLYDAQTGDLIATLNFYGGYLSFSGDSRYLVTGGRNLTATWDITALIANQPG